MDFATILAMLQNPGEDGHPEGIYDDLSASYTEATSTRDAKISESAEMVARLNSELQAAKAANWDLMQQIPQVASAPDAGNNDDNDSSDEESGEVGDDDDFFEKDND